MNIHGESEVNMHMPPTAGGIVAVLLISLIGYYFWRGTVVVMNARHQVADQGALLLDVGTPEEFTAAHIAGSINIPAPDVARHQEEIGPYDRPIVVYSRSGFHSARAAHVLRSIGYHSITNIGPMRRWGEPISEGWEGDAPAILVGRTPDDPKSSSSNALQSRRHASQAR
jgi:rhodanese-related sulfurtransferase